MLLKRADKPVPYLTFLGIGALTFFVGLLLWQLAPNFPASDYLAGMSIGISMVMNITGLWFLGKAHRKNR